MKNQGLRQLLLALLMILAASIIVTLLLSFVNSTVDPVEFHILVEKHESGRVTIFYETKVELIEVREIDENTMRLDFKTRDR